MFRRSNQFDQWVVVLERVDLADKLVFSTAICLKQLYMVDGYDEAKNEKN